MNTSLVVGLASAAALDGEYDEIEHDWVTGGHCMMNHACSPCGAPPNGRVRGRNPVTVRK